MTVQTVLLAVSRLPPAVVGAYRDGLPETWGLAVLDATGRCAMLADRRTIVLSVDAPLVTVDTLARLPPHLLSGLVLCQSDDGLLICPRPAPPLAIAAPDCLIAADVAPIPDPCYSPSSSARPEHFLGPVALLGSDLRAVVAAAPIRFDRWLGHLLALHALRQGGRIGVLPAEWPVLPSPVQWSGRDIHRSRLLAGPTLGLVEAVGAEIPGADPDLRSAAGAVRQLLERRRGSSPEGAWSDDQGLADKERVDRLLSRVTAGLVAQLPAAAPVSTARPALPRTATLAIIKLDAIGDAVLATPALRALRRAWSGEIRYLASASVRPLIEHCPYIDRACFIGSGPGLLDPEHGIEHLARWLPVVRDFLAGIDAALILRPAVDFYFAMPFAVLSGVPRLFGGVANSPVQSTRLNAGYRRSFTDFVEIAEPRHEAVAMGKLMAALGAEPIEPRCEVFTTREDGVMAMQFLAGTAGRRIGFGIGGQHGYKRWPASRYRALAVALRQQEDTTIVILGGDDVMVDAAEIAAADGVVNLCGRTTLRETAALLAELDCFVGNDSSALHLAAAAGIPLVEICAHPIDAPDDHDQSPFRFGPLGTHSVILRPAAPASVSCAGGCGEAAAHCILGIDVADVLDAVTRAIEDGPRA